MNNKNNKKWAKLLGVYQQVSVTFLNYQTITLAVFITSDQFLNFTNKNLARLLLMSIKQSKKVKITFQNIFIFEDLSLPVLVTSLKQFKIFLLLSTLIKNTQNLTFNKQNVFKLKVTQTKLLLIYKNISL